MPPVNDRARLSGRSAVSNGTRLFLQKTGIDYRTLTVRRLKDLIRSCSEDYEVTTEGDQALQGRHGHRSGCRRPSVS